LGAVRERRSYKQQTKTGSSHIDGPIIRSPAAADRAQPDLAAALAEIAAVFRAASDSIAQGDAELAATINSSQPSRPGLATTPVLDPLAYTVNDAARLLSISRSTINKLIRLNMLKTIKLLGKRLIPRASIEDLLAGKDK
jgi:excisionase family DNA binding protein